MRTGGGRKKREKEGRKISNGSRGLGRSKSRLSTVFGFGSLPTGEGVSARGSGRVMTGRKSSTAHLQTFKQQVHILPGGKRPLGKGG